MKLLFVFAQLRAAVVREYMFFLLAYENLKSGSVMLSNLRFWGSHYA